MPIYATCPDVSHSIIHCGPSHVRGEESPGLAGQRAGSSRRVIAPGHRAGSSRRVIAPGHRAGSSAITPIEPQGRGGRRRSPQRGAARRPLRSGQRFQERMMEDTEQGISRGGRVGLRNVGLAALGRGESGTE